ncbi:MAG: GAF domain-containing protein [Chloroflexi bacterium]|nr:MAG: GAF domain-containing protein [Chloroflexota bacterium]
MNAEPGQTELVNRSPTAIWFEEMIHLLSSASLEGLLNKAVNLFLQAVQAEAGSILYFNQHPYMARDGNLRKEYLVHFQGWEEAVLRRLQAGQAVQFKPGQLPIAAKTDTRTGTTLLNLPLISETRTLTGSLSLALPPGVSLPGPERQLLQRLALGLSFIISQRASLEQAHRRLKYMNLFYQVGQALMSTLDINRLLADTMKLAAEVIDAGAASLMLIDEENKELVFEVTLGAHGHILRQQRIPLDEGIAGWVARHGKPAITNNARADPRFSHRVDVRTGFLTQSIAAVPLKLKGRVIGVLEVLNKYAEEGFNDDDLQLMSVIAAQAAIAIENARLYERVRQERDLILQAQEEIRHELNRKLHDGPVQLLSAISVSLDHLEWLSKHKPEMLAEAFPPLRDLLRQAIKDTRTILFELRPIILETQGLVAALEQYVERLEESKHLTIHFTTVDRLNLPPQVANTIFLIVQEAVNNVMRHAEAQNLWLSVTVRHGYCIVTIRDDGKGFDQEKVEREYEGHSSFGLLNMKERAALIDARLVINSRASGPDRGTTVQLIVPLAEKTA